MKIVVCSLLTTATFAAWQTHAMFPSDVVKLMDETTDPCDDFYQYTCGGWIHNFTIPADEQTHAYVGHGIAMRAEKVIQDIINQKPRFIDEFYDSCMGVDTLTALGNQPLQKDLGRINAATSKTKLANIVGAISLIGPTLLAGVAVYPDPHNSSTYISILASSTLLLPNKDSYSKESFPDIEGPFRTYISKLVSLAGINPKHHKNTKHVEDVVIRIEKKLAKIQSTHEEIEDDYAIKYRKAAVKYPLTFGAIADGIGLLKKSAMSENSKVLVNSPTFMHRAEKLFKSLKLEDLKLYYAFRYASAYASYLGDAFVQAEFDFYSKTLNGVQKRRSRSKVCSTAVITFFPDLIGKYYADKMFDSKREHNVELMIKAIEQAMNQHIAKLTWLDDSTRKQAAAKLAKVINLIGYSKTKINYPFKLSRDNYFMNVQTIQMQWAKEDLARINTLADRREWGMSGAEVNAYYSPAQNTMVFPAAILQPPLYDLHSHPVQNFGAIGAIIGHELTHGFDTNGRTYDGEGNKREWWTNATTVEFEKRATCLKNQYSEIVVYGDSGKPVGHVNGNLTIGENIADNGGVSLAYNAYYNWIKNSTEFQSNTVKASEVDKLFFVSFGQMWCRKTRDDAQKQALATAVHAPTRARVNGVVMNSKQFAKAFQCKVSSKMNPKTKCQLW